MIHIEPLGTEIILPGFIIGWEENSTVTELVKGYFKEIPNWLITVDQQSGGYSMFYPSVVGVILRLQDNIKYIRQDPMKFIKGFELMAEDPSINQLKQDYPLLAEMVWTKGDEYTYPTLQEFHKYLTGYVSVPLISKGWEAYIEFEPVNPLAYFDNWYMLCVEKPEKAVDNHKNSNDIYLDGSNIKQVSLNSDKKFTEEIYSTLLAIRNGGEGPPRIYFMWENSD